MSYIINSDGNSLRTGFTTGTCASAAAKAALLSLLGFEPQSKVDVLSPEGILLTLPVEKVNLITDKTAQAYVVKDAGDDSDVTNGIDIYATVSIIPNSDEIIILGGDGVGRVTKEGLQCAVGAPAINPKPIEMLRKNLEPLKPIDCGLEVTISVPRGKEIAKKTLNERLGIIDGISIIGTTGIVRPMSEDAFMSSIYTELKQKRHLGVKELVLVPGKHGEMFCIKHLGIGSSQIVHMSNFVGFSLNAAVKLGFESVHMVGHIGKLVKLSGGIFNTHSKVADAKAEIICCELALSGAPTELIAKVFNSNTTDEISDILIATPYFSCFNSITERGRQKAIELIQSSIDVKLTIYDMKNRILGEAL